MGKKLNVVVVGAGRLGQVLAGRLSAAGHPVILIDRSQAALDSVGPEFTGFKILDEASELSTLRAAELDKASLVFAVTASDNLNLMVAQAAKYIFGVEKVRARVADPSRESLYARFGILTVNPTVLGADALLVGVVETSE